MKKLDYAIILFGLLAGLAGMILIFVNKAPGSSVYIYKDGNLFGVYSLDEDNSVEIMGSEGSNRIVIHDNKVYMEDADCPDGFCIRQGSIDEAGESICCAPHKVIIVVEATGEGEYDGITQ